MFEKLYVKYSNDREKSFKIRTEILRDQNKCKKVRKIGLNSESVSRLQTLPEKYNQLRMIFSNTRINMVECCSISNGIECPFVEGENLEGYLDELLNNGETALFVDTLLDFVNEVKKVAVDDYSESDDFERVFGSGNGHIGRVALKGLNLDMIFSNVLMDKGEYMVIDYEWTFDFCIPIDYILFRSIYYYLTPERKKIMTENRIESLYEIIGLTSDYVALCTETEKRFQEYVMGDKYSLGDFYDRIGKGFFAPAGKNVDNVSERRYGLLKRFTDGSLKAEPFVFKRDDGNGLLEIEITCEEDINFLSIGLGKKNCFVHVISLEAFSKKEKYNMNYFSNGISYKQNYICFDNENPSIMTDDFRYGVDSVKLVVKVDCPDKVMFDVRRECMDELLKLSNNTCL